MDRVTQNNASQTEEMSGTGTALLQHAEQLRDAVGRFNQGGSNAPVGAQSNRTRASAGNQRSHRGTGNTARTASQTLDHVAGQIDALVGNGVIEF